VGALAHPVIEFFAGNIRIDIFFVLSVKGEGHIGIGDAPCLQQFRLDIAAGIRKNYIFIHARFLLSN
jgi:hypothetical protein